MQPSPAPVSFGTLYGCTINFNGSFPAFQPTNMASSMANFDLTQAELNELISDFQDTHMARRTY